MELYQCINFTLSAAQHTVFQYLNEKLSPFKITPAQYGVLNILWSQGEAAPSQLAEKLYLEASSVSSVLDRMQKNDLIERNIDPNNRRTIVVSATAKGMELQKQVTEIIEEMNNKFLSQFTKKESQALLEALMKIAETK